VQDKIIELETKLSFQEDLLANLNDELVQQQRQISELLRELTLIKAHMTELTELNGKVEHEISEHEVPPHY